MGSKHLSDEKRIIVALDVDNSTAALHLADQFDPSRCRLKVGKELFTSEGPNIIEKLQRKGFEIFLDLKFHDIPNTTAAACRAAADLGVWMVNVHASGGRRMMEAAKEAVSKENHQPLLIAVTVLTSMGDEDLAEIGISDAPHVQVKRLAKLAYESGLDGLVCSAQEAKELNEIFGPKFSLVTPGIRPAGSLVGDQRRVMTPKDAIAAGATYLVVGRPITQAQDPGQALNSVWGEVYA